MDKILVTGASGNLGNAVVEALSGKGISVRAAARRTSKIKWKKLVQPVVFDYKDPGLFKAALDEVTGVFLIAPPLDPEAPAKLIPLIDKATDMGVKQIVFTSALKADIHDRNPLRIIELHLMKSKLDHVILRPNFFMENFSTGWVAPMIASGEIALPAGDGKTSFISVEDIARVATACFEQKRSGEQLNLTGREALTHSEAVRIISDACGRTVAYKPITETQMANGAREMGMPESAIDYIAQLFSLVKDGLLAETTDAVRRVTGKDPISFEEFARKNAEVWKVRNAA